MQKSYPLGSELNFVTTFTDAINHQPANPTNVRLRLLTPSAEEVDLTTPSNPSIGVFQTTYIPSQSGIWSWRWEGTGAVTAAEEGTFEIRASAFM